MPKQTYEVEIETKEKLIDISDRIEEAVKNINLGTEIENVNADLLRDKIKNM